MKKPVTLCRLKTKLINCIYNSDIFTQDEVVDLLSDDAANLLKDKECIFETRNATSFKINIKGKDYFAKEFKISKWYWQLVSLFCPASHRSFKSGINILQADLPTPLPVLSVVLKNSGKKRQILVTEFCQDAEGLREYIPMNKGPQLFEIMDEIVLLLANFYSKGFYSMHLRSTNILVTHDNGKRHFWLIDLERLSKNRFYPSSVFIGTVSRACFEFYNFLGVKERLYFLKKSFKAAIELGIFKNKDKEQWFINQCIIQIRNRQ